MKHDEAQSKLQDYADALLTAAESDAIEAHLADCEACSESLEQLLDLVAEAAALPAAIEPPRDLWQGIAEAIGRPEAPARIGAGARIRRLLPRPAWAWSGGLAAAALLLFVIIGNWGGYKPSLDQFADQGVPIGSPVNLDPTADMTIASLEAECRVSVARGPVIRDTIASPTGEVTLALIEENLRLIDLAIAQAREAWEKDPHNPHLARMVSAAYRAKARLQAEAARIVDIT